MFFVYTLSYPNGLVFYVGKAKAMKRLSGHLWEAKNGCQTRKCRTIRKIYREGGQVEVDIVSYFEDEGLALMHEKMLIASIGRENLTNCTDGGDNGPTGMRHSLETRAEMSRTRKGRKLTEQDKRNKSIALKGRVPALSTRIAAQTVEARAKRNDSISKTYLGFISPDGTVYRNVKSLSKFCREHNLGLSNMCWLAKGKAKTHKKWRALLPDCPTDPDG